MTRCLCGEEAVEVLGTRDDRDVGRCACGLVRTLNPPQNYNTLYTDGTTYHEGREGHASYRERFNHDYGVAMQRWSKFHQQWRTLDVGAANGAFVAMAYDHGCRSEGLEPNPTMARWSEKMTHCRIATSWEQVFGQFDLITYHDVIEHIADPVAELSQARDRLLPGGWLVIDTPDTADSRFQDLGVQWHHCKPREHLWLFNTATLRAVVKKAGLTTWGEDRPIPGKLVIYVRNFPSGFIPNLS